MDLGKPRVLYVLSHPFSGSTLFSVVLGAADGMVNVGEASYLANDFHETTRCLCGKALADCEFWQAVVRGLEAEQAGWPAEARLLLDDRAGLSGPDRRNKPIFARLKLWLGSPMDRIFSRTEMDQYARQQRVLYKVLRNVGGGRWIIDSSKSPHRLQVLAGESEIDLRVVWLRRSMRDLLASKMKREKRRHRYVPLVSVLYDIAWLLAYEKASRRAYDRVPPSARTEIAFEDFLLAKDTVRTALANLLDWTESDIEINQDEWDVSGQHIYAGNRWLFKLPDDGRVVVRRATEENDFSRLEGAVIRAAGLFFPALKT